MFGNFSMPELLIVGALALIIIGPKDLMDDAAREVDLQEFKDARALMDKKADTKGLSDTLNKSIGLDDDDEKPKKPAMDRAEMAEAAKNFSDEPKAEKPKPASKPEPEVAKADPEPATASQG